MFESSWSIISAFIVFLLGLIIIAKISGYFGLKKNRGLLIYVWHTLFCFVYFFYAQAYGADALMYYDVALTGRFDFKFGTSFVIAITSLLVQGLEFGIVSCFLFFNIIGSIGLLAVDGSLKQATQYQSKFLKRLATIIVFLPSISFWSAAIGKDAISFMAMGLALWATLQLNKRMLLMFGAIVMMLIVRPHMAGMMVIALAMSVMFNKKSSPLKRISLGLVAIAGAAAIVPFALEYAGVSDPSSSEGLMDYVENRQSYNMEGGGGVDIANMSLPLQLFTYMFRPIIFEARSITALAAAIDNLILLYLFIVGVYALIKKRSQNFTGNRKFMWVYVILAWVVLAMTTANLGIAIRQKWMFAPMLIFLLISLAGKKQKSFATINRSR